MCACTFLAPLFRFIPRVADLCVDNEFDSQIVLEWMRQRVLDDAQRLGGGLLRALRNDL